MSKIIAGAAQKVLVHDLVGNEAIPRSSSVIGEVKTGLFRFLDTNGNGSGTKSAVADYSGGEIFYIQPGPTEVYRIARLLLNVVDAGTFDSGSYGNGITLTNGISIRVQDDNGTILDLVNGVTIKVNPDWGRYCYDVSLSSFGVGNEHLHARWTFTQSGTWIRLNGANNERLEIVLQDNFSGLIEHYFMVQGYIE